jgi:hypothetical protein
MAVAGRMGITVYETETGAPEMATLRQRISKMSSSELLRFGVNAKFRCSHGPELEHAQRVSLETQLIEARTEWNRRYPGLPLRDSF